MLDETKRPIYQAVVEKYLNSENMGQIAIWLIENKISTPYNIKPDGKDTKAGQKFTVRRLPISDIHLRYITYGKSKLKLGQVALIPEEEIIKMM
ncbi:hypothetical protein [Brevibacillus sp. SIMBA_040]|uniref:hypothetical protein n=1 Tax=Brevibacillus sp. SIMBA_040 TaxID=3085781 RepID=UPI00397907C2